ncbi:Rab32-like protein [Dinothrombium tinctorium]|uniref:Ras-related protein Rab n=1 Tax=Dinothrombium tinctorium TaxID=1965070 RepID=A0A443RHK7_9ACAR|nr:Rab32-like protein [Dinothrombium tinctorium]
MDDEKRDDTDKNESSDDESNSEAEEFISSIGSSSSSSSLKTIDDKCCGGDEMRQLITNDSHDIEAKQSFRSEAAIYDQEEKLKKTFAEIKKHTKEYFFKLLVIGEIGTGKTSFINRYVHKQFSTQYRATIGLDFALKVINWDKNTIIRLQLWDIAGQERFGSMTRVYYKEAVGAFVVFDVTRKQSLDHVIKWKSDLDAKVCLPDGEPIPSVLLANKCDLNKDEYATNASLMNQFCEKHQFSGWFYTSAKNNINIDECANFLISKVLEKHTLFLDSWHLNSDILNLSANVEEANRNRCRC